jgi:hypothetical protein
MNNNNYIKDCIKHTEALLSYERKNLSKQMKIVLDLEARLATENQRLRDAETEESLKSLISLNHIA